MFYNPKIFIFCKNTMEPKNVTFISAYCLNSNAIINVHHARENYWDKSHPLFNQDLKYQCPDEQCVAPFIGVGIKPLKPIKCAMHFRISSRCNHDELCQFDHILNNPQKSDIQKTYEITQRLDPIPNIFKLITSSTPADRLPLGSKSAINNPQSTRNTISHNICSHTNGDRDHTTGQLERLVSVFTTFSAKFLKENNHLLSLAGETPRPFASCFKKIRYFADNNNPYIFYGKISNVVSGKYGKYIYFEHKEPYGLPNGDIKRLPIGMFISNQVLESHRRKYTFLNFFELIPTKEHTAIAYFVGTYPELITTHKDTLIYSIKLEHLNQLWLEWDS